jgi:hypothetical protein
MIRWEYKNVRNIVDPDIFNECGQNGWELVSVVVINNATNYFFKRPVTQDDRR